MKFDLNEVELKNLEKFKEALEVILLQDDEEYLPGSWSYVFTPTAIGVACDAEYTHTDTKVYTKNITDYDCW